MDLREDRTECALPTTVWHCTPELKVCPWSCFGFMPNACSWVDWRPRAQEWALGTSLEQPHRQILALVSLSVDLCGWDKFPYILPRTHCWCGTDRPSECFHLYPFYSLSFILGGIWMILKCVNIWHLHRRSGYWCSVENLTVSGTRKGCPSIHESWKNWTKLSQFKQDSQISWTGMFSAYGNGFYF